jgi:hypothetical protein
MVAVEWRDESRDFRNSSKNSKSSNCALSPFRQGTKKGDNAFGTTPKQRLGRVSGSILGALVVDVNRRDGEIQLSKKFGEFDPLLTLRQLTLLIAAFVCRHNSNFNSVGERRPDSLVGAPFTVDIYRDPRN